MNIPQPFDTSGDKPQLFNGETLPDAEPDAAVAQPQVPTESQWRRVLDVILVEGQIRYLVDRGE